jgi:hypothetical protein
MSSTNRELKPKIYYLMRRGWYESIITYVNDVPGKKGSKDPFTVYWKAVAIGMDGATSEALRLFESLHVRKDLQYAVALAQLYFLQSLT